MHPELSVIQVMKFKAVPILCLLLIETGCDCTIVANSPALLAILG